MKIALFQYPGFNFASRTPISESDARYTSAVRVSEWSEVDFVLHPAEVIRRDLILAIEKEIEEITSGAKDETLQRLRKRAAELRASGEVSSTVPSNSDT